MKWRLMAAFAVLCMLIPAFVSCDKDKDEEPADGVSVTGSYTGTLEYNVGGVVGPLDGEYEFSILGDPDNADRVTVVIPECTFTPPIPQARPFTIPSLTVADVAVTVKESKFLLKKDEFSLTIDEKPYEGSNLEGTVNGNTMESLYYNLRPGGMPMDIVFTFTGTRK